MDSHHSSSHVVMPGIISARMLNLTLVSLLILIAHDGNSTGEEFEMHYLQTDVLGSHVPKSQC